MKKSLKRALALTLSLMLVVATASFGSISPLGAVKTYTAGPNISASFNTATGILTLTGTGATYDFRNTSSNILGTKQTPWSADKANITSVVVGEGITTIGDYCFYSCVNLTDVSLPSTLTKISGSGTRDGETTSFGAFRECTSLQSITLPSGLQEIGTAAFRGCTALKSITLPDSLTTLGGAAFTACTSLRTVTFGSGLTKVPLEAFYGDTNIKFINWNESINEVGEWAFYNCGMNEVDLPEHISKISARAFADCYFLLRATIHNVDCNIASLSFNNTRLTAPQDFTVVGHTGSTAQTFANDKGYTFVSLDDCSHENTTTRTITPATCTEAGLSETVCDDCNRVVFSTELAPLGHNYQEESRADDTELDGHIRIYSRCTRCNDVKTDISHVETEDSTTLRRRYVWVDGYYTVSSRGNCQTGVISTYSCSVEGCRAMQVMEAVTSGHEVANWITVKSPTCTEAGTKTGHCSRCDNDVVEDIPATGHDYEGAEYSRLVDKTDEDGHIYRYYPCNVCGVEKEVAEHIEWMELMYTPNVILPPTCTTGGMRRDTCDICKTTRDVELENNGGHDWVETSHEEPTCTAKGQTNYQCSKCQLTRKENTDALGHDLVKVDGGSKLPTCTEDGYTSYECSRCSYSKQDVVVALGHQSDDEAYSVTQEPSCETAGAATSVCLRCKNPYDIVLEPLGHEYENVEAPVEGQPGHSMSTPTCIRCSSVQPATKVHNEWIDGDYTTQTIIEANCITGQTVRDTCNYCGATRTRTEGEGATHELKYLRFVSTTGTITYTCKHCAIVTTARAADVYLMWDNDYYNTVPQGRIAENPSTYLDVNGDDFINAKDFALLRNMYKKSLEQPTQPENPDENGDENENGEQTGGSSEEGGNGSGSNLSDIIGGLINDRRDNENGN